MRNQSETPNLAAVKTPISQEGLDQLFLEARTHSTWLPEPVPVELLRKAYELARLGPTSANGSPARRSRRRATWRPRCPQTAARSPE